MKNRSTKPNKKTPYVAKTAAALSTMSQEELIKQGFRNPYFVKPDFSKTPEERKAWRKVHKNKGVKYSGVSGTSKGAYPQAEQNLLVHVANNGTNKNYKSTLSFKVKASDVQRILRIFLKDEVVTKAYFAGKIIVDNSN